MEKGRPKALFLHQGAAVRELSPDWWEDDGMIWFPQIILENYKTYIMLILAQVPGARPQQLPEQGD